MSRLPKERARRTGFNIFSFVVMSSALVLILLPANLLAAGYDNQITNGSFELGHGPSTGLVQHLDVEKGLIKFDNASIDSEEHQHGSQSLLIDAKQGQTCELWFRGGPITNGQTLTFAFSVKTDRASGVHVRGSTLNAYFTGLGEFNIDPNEQWQRAYMTTTVDTAKCKDWINLDIMSWSDDQQPYKIWIDDVCIRPGSASEYSSAGLVEAVVDDNGANSKFYDNEEIKLSLGSYYYGESHGPITVHVETRVIDNYFGNVVASQTSEFELSAKTGAVHKPLNIGVLPTGVYQLNTVVYNSDRTEILHSNWYRFGVIRDISSVPGPVGFEWGVFPPFIVHGSGMGPNGGHDRPMMFLGRERGGADLDEFFGWIREAGVTFLRWSIRPLTDRRYTEPEEGKYFWDYWDLINDAAKRHGMKLFPISPPDGCVDEGNHYTNHHTPSENPDWLFKKSELKTFGDYRSRKWENVLVPEPLMKSYFADFTKRYRNNLLGYEVINEVNIYMTPETLLNWYVKPIYEAVKETAPEVKVAAPCVVFNLPYIDQFLIDEKGVEYTDVVIFHPYEHSTLTYHSKWETKKLKSDLDKVNAEYGTNIELWEGECFEFRPGILGNQPMAWEAMQRLFTDWIYGCKTSFALKAGELYGNQVTDFVDQKTPSVFPGQIHVGYNTAYHMLSGASLVRPVELDRMVLAGLFKSDANYTFVVSSQDLAEMSAVMTVTGDLDGVTMYDIFGRKIGELDGNLNDIELSRDIKYLKFPLESAEVARHLENSVISWKPKRPRMRERIFNGDLMQSSWIKHGMPTKTPMNDVGEYLTGWWMLGPFVEGDIDHSYIKETALCNTAKRVPYNSDKVKWCWYETNNELTRKNGAGKIIVSDYYLPDTNGDSEFVAYCYRTVNISEDGDYTVRFNAEHDGLKLYVNGELQIFAAVPEKWNEEIDPHSLKIHLAKGQNSILVKINSVTEKSGFHIIIE